MKKGDELSGRSCWASAVVHGYHVCGYVLPDGKTSFSLTIWLRSARHLLSRGRLTTCLRKGAAKNTLAKDH